MLAAATKAIPLATTAAAATAVQYVRKSVKHFQKIFQHSRLTQRLKSVSNFC